VLPHLSVVLTSLSATAPGTNRSSRRTDLAHYRDALIRRYGDRAASSIPSATPPRDGAGGDRAFALRSSSSEATCPAEGSSTRCDAALAIPGLVLSFGSVDQRRASQQTEWRAALAIKRAGIPGVGADPRLRGAAAALRGAFAVAGCSRPRAIWSSPPQISALRAAPCFAASGPADLRQPAAGALLAFAFAMLE